MSLYPTFSLHLEYGSFTAETYPLDGHDVCVLKIESPDGVNLSLFFPEAERAMADEIAAKLSAIAATFKKEAA